MYCTITTLPPDIRMLRSAIDFTGTNVASPRAYADAVIILRASLVPGCAVWARTYPL